jgi:hypothetical protein
MVVRALLAAGVIAAAFVGGRASVQRPSVPPGGYRAGYEAAFSGFDGGWAYATPYIVTLRRGGDGITYRFARRWPMQPGVSYRACGHTVCMR